MTSPNDGTEASSIVQHFTTLSGGPGRNTFIGLRPESLLRVDARIRCSAKRDSSDQNWWMVADASDQTIGSYYRHLYWLDHNKGRKLLRPYWPLHVTIVRNEMPPNHGSWWSYDGEVVAFYCVPRVRDNDGGERYRSFYWLDVISSRFEEIRVELGLKKNPDGIYHMTIGTTENEDNKAAYQAMWAGDQKGPA